MELQKRVFEAIKLKIPKNVLLVEEVERVLGRGNDSAYRRIRCETELTISELQKICEAFDLSIDDLLHNKSKIASFSYAPVVLSGEEDYITYMSQMAKWLKDVAEYGVESEFLFTAQDIPFYHFTKYPELTFFKLFAWDDAISPLKSSYRNFCKTINKERIIDLYKSIYHSFLHIPSKEIWSEQTINPILRLLEYYFSIEALNKDDAMLLLDCLANLIKDLNQYADQGHKNDSKIPFSLYLCSVDLENNFMLIKKGNHLSCILKLYSVNRIMTSNESLCFVTHKWINSLISKSNLISGNAAFRDRLYFFKTAKDKIQNLIDKIESQVLPANLRKTTFSN